MKTYYANCNINLDGVQYSGDEVIDNAESLPNFRELLSGLFISCEEVPEDPSLLKEDGRGVDIDDLVIFRKPKG